MRAVGRPQEIVDRIPARRRKRRSRFRARGPDVGGACRRPRYPIDRIVRVVPVVDQVHDRVVALHVYHRGLRIQMNLDPIACQSIRKKLRRIPLFVAEKHRLVLNQGDPRSQASKGLRELAPDWAPADDQ